MPGIEYASAKKGLGARAIGGLIALIQGINALRVDQSQALAAATHAALPRRHLSSLRAMYTAVDELSGDNDANQSVAALQGQLLRLSERREVAIYLRNGAIWVADFIDGQGAIVDASTWLRFNCGTPHSSHSRRRMSLESAIPVSVQLAARIESLHRRLSKDESSEEKR